MFSLRAAFAYIKNTIKIRSYKRCDQVWS